MPLPPLHRLPILRDRLLRRSSSTPTTLLIHCDPEIPAEPSRAERVRSLESRIAVMRKYLAARAAEAEDPETMLALCGELLDQPDADQAIRTGDVFALLIEHYFKGGEAEK